MRNLLKISAVLAVVALVALSGCSKGYRTVYVPQGDAVRLRQDIKRVDVWIKSRDGEVLPGNITIPEGWY